MTTFTAKILTPAALTATAALLLTGCGTGGEAAPADGGSPTTTASSTPSATTQPGGKTSASGSPTPAEQDQSSVVDVTVDGDTITPNGERIDLAVGETMRLDVTADRPGELHVHSSPEQTLTYAKGATALRLKIDHPGVIDVEDHDTGHVVIQLEVR